MKVRYIGVASEAQMRWGNDPRDVLLEGQIYEVKGEYIHPWHTLLTFVGVDGKFNSVCFEEIEHER